MIAPNTSVEYEFAITDIAAILCEVTTLKVISTIIIKSLDALLCSWENHEYNQAAIGWCFVQSKERSD